MIDEIRAVVAPSPLSVTVGIISRTRNPGLLRLVKGLESSGSERPAEIVVAIETDGTTAVSETRDDNGTRWLAIPARRGLGYNRNRVVEASTHEIVVFADDDCEPEPGWLSELLRPLADESVDAVVGSVRIPSAGPIGDAISALGFPAGGSAGFDTMFAVAKDGTTDNLTTCNCAIRMSVFQRLGGFDETMMFGGEDTEFGLRMRDAGLRLVYHRPATVVHAARTDLVEFIAWFYRRGRAKRQFVRRVPAVGSLVRRRLESYGRIIRSRAGEPLVLVIAPLLVASIALQQAGFIAEVLSPTPFPDPLPEPAEGIAGVLPEPAEGIADPLPEPNDSISDAVPGGVSTRVRSVARGTLLGVMAQGWHLATAMLLYAFLGRRLGAAGFGRWKLVLSVLNWFELAVNSGLVKVTVKSMAERPADRARLERASYLGQALVALGLFALALVTAGPIAASLKDPSLALPLRIASLDIPVYAAFMVAASILLGVQDFERQALGMAVYAGAKSFLIAGLVAGGLSIPGALIGNALASVVGFAVTFSRWDEGHIDRHLVRAEARWMALASMPFLSLSLIEGVYTTVGLWAVQGMLGHAVQVGLYGAAVTLAEVPAFLFLGLNRALFPSVARAQAESDPRMLSRYARQAVRLATLVTVLGVALVAATGRQALQLVLGPGFAGAAVPLTILMVAALGRAVHGACMEVLMAQDRRRTAIGILVGSVCLETMLLVALVPAFGLNGAASAAALSALAAAVACCAVLWGQLTARVVVTVVRSVAAAAPVAVALVALSPSPLGLLAAYPLAVASYALLLRLLGEIDADDIGSILAALPLKRRAR